MVTDTVNLQIALLYERCTALRRIFIAIEQQAQVVQEVSLNASVSAGHLGSHATACGEIAQQVNGTARRMAASIETMREEVNHITNQVLTMLVHTSRFEKYELAYPSVSGASNQEAVREILDTLRNGIVDMAARLQHHVHRTQAQLRLLARCHQRLFIALSAFEIAAVDLSHASSAVIMALVDRLSAITDDANEQSEAASAVLAGIRKLAFFIQENTYKEAVRAKVRVA